MHRALLVHEILEQIFDFVAHDKDIWHHHGHEDLLHLALTCKAWSDIALSALWAKIINFNILLHKLPELRASIGGEWVVSHELSDLDIGDFLRCSRKMKELDLRRAVYRSMSVMSDSVFTALDTLKQRIDLFPRLTSLCFDPYTLSAHHATLFTSARLTNLEIEVAPNFQEINTIKAALQSFIRLLVDHSLPRLASIRVSGDIFDPPTLVLLSQIHSLRRVCMRVGVPHQKDRAFLDALYYIWRVQGITELRLQLGNEGCYRERGGPPPPPPPLPPGRRIIKGSFDPLFANEHILVADQTYEGLSSVLHTLMSYAPRCRRLQLTVRQDISSIHWTELIRAVFKRPTSSLQNISVHFRGHTLLPATAMLDMPRYENLQVLVMRAPLDWTDDVIEHVARSCPALISVWFFLDAFFEDGPHLSSAALVYLAVHCKQLKRLGIRLNPMEGLSRGWLIAPTAFDGQENLLKLEIQFWPYLNEPHESFARLLRWLFPRLEDWSGIIW
ncbi:hypothetical protein PUNSTDRAFT_130900 [Punctularia strigosozonata HHB-11173 SS5]|uniref:uncharacterized protein n=1 Tax=Punctularia strigosozonata (strain HHB-11173) TaxID=741275 RepID=UPI00044182F0|nr:uncharacterized protein PUNSTDRAFT_130900 [Punctularia strigosozonata HHB-11173 SS5]EIN12643.1 hypothetical protein PUNSTDRAFT_130900 [Punctularia strigosozonata HHB-11173 SS5]